MSRTTFDTTMVANTAHRTPIRLVCRCWTETSSIQMLSRFKVRQALLSLHITPASRWGPGQQSFQS